MRGEFLTSRELAAQSGYSVHSIRRWARKGLIKYRRLNGRMLFLPDAVARLLAPERAAEAHTARSGIR